MKNQLDTTGLQPLNADQVQQITGGNIDIDIFNHMITAHIETDINYYLHF